jgi:hypothetical protein
VPGTSSGGGIGIGLINIPASFTNIPNSAEWILERLTPDTTTTREFQVMNSTDKPMFVVIYPGAATNNKGVFVGAPRGVTNELTSWSTVTPKSATIPAHQRIQGSITITVPTDAEPSMQYGLIWAQTTVGTSGGVTQVNRVGIRMYDPVGDFVVPEYVSKAPTNSTSTSGAVSARASDAPSTGFVVTQAESESFTGIPAGLEWAAIGFLVAVVAGFLFKKITMKDKIV